MTSRAQAPLVLVVDDEADSRDILRMLLVEMGYRVATAHDGAHGLAQARGLGPQVVLTDLLMPGIDGIALAKALRADPATAPIRVILCSGIAEGRVHAMFSDYDAYLEKPYEVAWLERLMARLAPLTLRA